MRPTTMRAPLLLMLALSAGSLRAQTPGQVDPVPGPEPTASMSELMVHVIYPASDAIFYITSREPTTTEEWSELEMKALMVAESGNLLMLPGYRLETEGWMRDARLLRDAGRAAFQAARARDLDALAELNDPLYRSCVSCHRATRPDYGRPPQQ